MSKAFKLVPCVTFFLVSCTPADAQIAEAKGEENGQSMVVRNVAQTLLQRGLKFDVYVQTKPMTPGPSGALPSLVVFGFIDQPGVRSIVKSTDMITAAKRVGFQSVHILDKAGDGGWIFDLTRPHGPYCSRGLCF